MIPFIVGLAGGITLGWLSRLGEVRKLHELAGIRGPTPEQMAELAGTVAEARAHLSAARLSLGARHSSTEGQADGIGGGDE